MMKIYMTISCFVVFQLSFLGVLLPYLYSLDSDLAVLLGLIITLLDLPLSYTYLKWSFK